MYLNPDADKKIADAIIFPLSLATHSTASEIQACL